MLQLVFLVKEATAQWPGTFHSVALKTLGASGGVSTQQSHYNSTTCQRTHWPTMPVSHTIVPLKAGQRLCTVQEHSAQTPERVLSPLQMSAEAFLPRARAFRSLRPRLWARQWNEASSAGSCPSGEHQQELCMSKDPLEQRS